jgi:hypothetical protein
MLIANKGGGIEVSLNAIKTKQAFMYPQQNAGQNYNLKTTSKSLMMWQSPDILEK